MQTRAKGIFPAENFAVARVRRNFMGRSDVGAMFINRQATDGGGTYNRSYGFDANIRPTPNLVISSYYARTDDSEITGDQWAGRAVVGFRDPFWDTSAFVKHVGDAFVPRVGFVRRLGVNQAYATLGVHPQRPLPHLQELNPYAEFDYIETLDGELQTRVVTGALSAEFLDGSTLTVKYNDRFEHLFEDFEIQPGAIIPVGRYGFREGIIAYRSSRGRPLSGNVGITWGGFFNGNKTTLDLSAHWRVDQHLYFDAFVERNHVTLPDAEFSADVYGGRVNLAATTRLYLSGYIQHNAAVKEMISNIRFNFIHSPLSDLFVVYTERRSTGGFGVLDRVFTVKVTKMFEF
jgi:hypothetical protein